MIKFYFLFPHSLTPPSSLLLLSLSLSLSLSIEDTNRTDKVINKLYYILTEHSGAEDQNTSRNAGVIIIANQHETF